MTAVGENLRGRVALVTGASRGIGKGIALALASAGVAVAVNFRSREMDANEVVAAIGAMGQRAFSIRADVSKQGQVERLLAETQEAFGPVDILVNNAGIARPVEIDSITADDWDFTHSANLRSAFLVTQAFLPSMRERKWGRLLFLGSVAAQVGGIIGPDYASSKAGLVGLMHYYAHHLAKEGITANVLAPALVETEMVTSNVKADPSRLPVGRFGTLDEAGEIALAILSNGFLTGQTVNLNGGFYPSS